MKQIFKGVIAALTICCTACNDNSDQEEKPLIKMKKENTMTTLPTAAKWVSSDLRNRIKLELNAPVSEVWALVGDPAKMPLYSDGLKRVETKKDNNGRCTEYICHFKPIEEGGQEIVHRSSMLWYEQNSGWASRDEEPNAFGFRESITLVTLQQKEEQTVLDWAMHFECESPEMLQMNVSSLGQALNRDIATRLIQKFGGRIVESTVNAK